MAQCIWPGKDSRVQVVWREDFRCTRDAHPGHEHCLFHIPLKEKNQDQELRSAFETEFRTLYEQGDWDFTGFEFPDKTNMREWDFRRSHEIGGREPAEGGDAGPAKFSFSTFGFESDFSNATFGDSAFFYGAIIGDRASFSDTIFGDQALFWHATFGDYTFFDRATFGDKASFYSATFGDSASFYSATFGDSASFSGADFKGEVSWKHVSGQERAYLAKGGPKGGDASFEGELFRPSTPEMIFEKTAFNGPALFRSTDLSRARFQQVDLRNVSFLHSQISQTKFISCTWGKGLENRRFLQHFSLRRDRPLLHRLGPLLRFHRPRLLFDELIWRRWKKEKGPDNPGFPNWLWTIMKAWRDGPINYVLRALAVEPFVWLWQPLRTGTGGTKDDSVLQAELLAELQPSDIEVLALQLKKSLEDTKDPIAAGDFHFAVMEMKREQAREQGRWTRAAGLWLYKMINGYGERYGRTALWIGLLVAASAGLYSWLGGLGGLEYVKEAIPNGGKAADIAALDYLSFALQNVLPFKFGAPILKATQPWVRLLCFAETFIGTTLFTFFALALRRRFKR